jgi:hypothetical protein
MSWEVEFRKLDIVDTAIQWYDARRMFERLGGDDEGELDRKSEELVKACRRFIKQVKKEGKEAALRSQGQEGEK